MADSNDKTRLIFKFKGDNYSSWKFRMMMLFREKEILKVIQNEAPLTLLKDWFRAENLALNLITQNISDSFLHFIKPDSTAKNVFESLDSIYERKSWVTQYVLKKKLNNLKLSADGSLINHFIVFDNIVDQISAAGNPMTIPDVIIHLIMSLPDTYETILSAFQTVAEKDLSINYIKSQLLEYEMKINSSKLEHSSKVLYTHQKAKSNNKYAKVNKFKK